MEFFVDTANECSRLNNFNSYMAIAGEKISYSKTRINKPSLCSWSLHESCCQTEENCELLLMATNMLSSSFYAEISCQFKET